MMNRKTLSIDGMHCSRCAVHVQTALENVEGVTDVRVGGWKDGWAEVALSDGVDDAKLVAAVEAKGYRAEVTDASTEQPARPEIDVVDSAGSGDYDLIVIGGGSAAFAAALKASELGGRAAIVNDGLPMGGTCVNVGCVPSKTMIRAAEAVRHARHTPFKGIKVDGDVLDFGEVTRQTQSLVRELRQAKYFDVVRDDPNITLLEARGRLASPNSVHVNGTLLTAGSIVVATGARTFVPDIPGLAETGYLTNEGLYQLKERPDHLIVLGGRYIALENAQAFARLGSRVTVLQRSDRILPSESPDISKALTRFLVDEGVDVRTGVRTVRVGRNGDAIVVEAEIDGEPQSILGSHVLVATGRRANTEDLRLEELGIETRERGFLRVGESLRTAVPSILGAGDVLGEQMFVYTAAYEGSLAAENAMTGLDLPRDYSVLPWVVFTDPQVAGVGHDEAQAEEAGIEYDVSKVELDIVPRSIAARDTRGFIKLLRDRVSDCLIGARILAPEGSELLMEVALAIKHRIRVQELATTFHPYLTLGEGIKLAAIAFDHDVKRLSCCAA